jgi:hypothetical protein
MFHEKRVSNFMRCRFHEKIKPFFTAWARFACGILKVCAKRLP